MKTLTIIEKVSLSTLFATILLLMGCFIITSCAQKQMQETPIEIEIIQEETSEEEPIPHIVEEEPIPLLKRPRTVKEWLNLHGYKIEKNNGGISLKGSHNTGEGISLIGEGDGNYRLTVSGIGTAILKSDAAGNLIIEELTQ